MPFEKREGPNVYEFYIRLCDGLRALRNCQSLTAYPEVEMLWEP